MRHLKRKFHSEHHNKQYRCSTIICGTPVIVERKKIKIAS